MLQHFSSAVNVLTDSPRISYVTKRDVFQLIFSQTDEIIIKKCCCADFRSVWDPLIRWLLKGVLKKDFLEFK